mmetsp:Transcript_21536/g.35538  ORF Transcript_21536/g.35538 Transcript_21536/m.35538 type:complete len:205 (+) Transcript_21536:272-886(+)
MVARSFRSTWLSWRPRVCLLEKFMDAHECKALIQLGTGRMQRTQKSNPSISVLRSARGCWLPRTDDPLLSWRDVSGARFVLAEFEERVAHVTGIPLMNGEPSQLLRYREGEQYSVHPDFFDPSDAAALANGGQRLCTLLAYLSTWPARLKEVSWKGCRRMLVEQQDFPGQMGEAWKCSQSWATLCSGTTRTAQALPILAVCIKA